MFHEHTKHIEIDYYFVRDEFQANLVAPVYLSTDSQPTDPFTKVLGASQFIICWASWAFRIHMLELAGDVEICYYLRDTHIS